MSVFRTGSTGVVWGGIWVLRQRKSTSLTPSPLHLQAPHPILLLPGCSPPPSRYSPWKSVPSWPQSNGKTARPGGGKIPPEPEPGPPGAGQTLPLLLLLLLLPPRKAIKMPLPRKDSGQGVTERGFFVFFFEGSGIYDPERSANP